MTVPNWCHNTLKITGEDTDELERFVKRAVISEEDIQKAWDDRLLMPESYTEQALATKPREEFDEMLRRNQPLTFSAFVPEPEEHEPEVEGEWFSGWYGWRIKHWGTKWDASFDGPGGAIVFDDGNVETSVDAQGATITKYAAFYKFDTAWSPPVPFVHQTSEQFPTLTFTLRWAEVGNGFAGQGIYKAGEIIEETELEVEDVLAPEEMWF